MSDTFYQEIWCIFHELFLFPVEIHLVSFIICLQKGDWSRYYAQFWIPDYDNNNKLS